MNASSSFAESLIGALVGRKQDIAPFLVISAGKCPFGPGVPCDECKGAFTIFGPSRTNYTKKSYESEMKYSHLCARWLSDEVGNWRVIHMAASS